MFLFLFFNLIKRNIKIWIVYPFKRYNVCKKIILLQYTTEQLRDYYKNENRGKVILINWKYCNSTMKKKNRHILNDATYIFLKRDEQ